MGRKRYRLAERRKAVGLSQERLAEIVGVDRSTVVRWERGDTEPQPWHRPRLAHAIKVSVEELAALLADVGAARSISAERLDHVLRHPGSVDRATAADLRDRVRRLDEQYERTPSTSLLAGAGQLHGEVVYLRRQARTEPVRRALAAVEAETATLMGQLVWDASQRRDHTTAVAYFDHAIAAANYTGDIVNEAHAHLRKSYVALYGLKDPHAGLALAHHAARVSHPVSNVIAGLALLHAGEGHAMLGDAANCFRAVERAKTHHERTTTEDPARILFCQTQHGRLVGSCFLFLGMPKQAARILDATRQILGDPRKANAIVLGNLALAAIRQRDIDAAAVRLHETIDNVARTRGAGGLNVLFTAARELRPWRNEPVVQEVTDRLFDLMVRT